MTNLYLEPGMIARTVSPDEPLQQHFWIRQLKFTLFNPNAVNADWHTFAWHLVKDEIPHCIGKSYKQCQIQSNLVLEYYGELEIIEILSIKSFRKIKLKNLENKWV
jgi:hypothetical protein